MIKINKKIKFILSITVFLIILSLTMGTVVYSSQVELKWLYSFETLLFDTESGWIEPGQYAIGEHGHEYYVCEKGEQCDPDIVLNEVDVAYDVSHLKKVNLIGKQYFDVFRDLDGSKLRVKADKDKYKRLFDTPGYPQPTKNKISFPLLIGRQAEAITYGNFTNSTEQSNASSFSFNHTTTGNQVALVISVVTDDGGCSDPELTDVKWEAATISDPALFICNTSNYISSEIWYKTDAGAVTNGTVALTFLGTVSEIIAIASHYNNVDTTDAQDGGNTATGTGDPTVTVDTNSTDAWLVDAMAIANRDGGSETVSNYNKIDLTDVGSETLGASYRDTTGSPTGYAISWDDADNDHGWTQAAIALKPYVIPPTAPTIEAVADSPNIALVGQTITFSVDWDDINPNEEIKAKICKTELFTNQNCDDGHYASSSAFTANDPENNLEYTVQSTDLGLNDYYAYVCDDGGLCSSFAFGTFGVGGTIRVKGDVRVKGNVRIKRY